MSAQLQWRSTPALRGMQASDLDAVLAIEQLAYAFPWTRGNFIDSLAAGYEACVLVDDDAQVRAYFMAMHGVDELHLLNITVAPDLQGQGRARQLLDALRQRAKALQCRQIWLEVRQGNERARQIYRRYGFAEVGLRRAYYPAGGAQREDAVLMSLSVVEGP